MCDCPIFRGSSFICDTELFIFTLLRSYKKDDRRPAVRRDLRDLLVPPDIESWRAPSHGVDDMFRFHFLGCWKGAGDQHAFRGEDSSGYTCGLERANLGVTDPKMLTRRYTQHFFEA